MDKAVSQFGPNYFFFSPSFFFITSLSWGDFFPNIYGCQTLKNHTESRHEKEKKIRCSNKDFEDSLEILGVSISG